MIETTIQRRSAKAGPRRGERGEGGGGEEEADRRADGGEVLHAEKRSAEDRSGRGEVGPGPAARDLHARARLDLAGGGLGLRRRGPAAFGHQPHEGPARGRVFGIDRERAHDLARGAAAAVARGLGRLRLRELGEGGDRAPHVDARQVSPALHVAVALEEALDRVVELHRARHPLVLVVRGRLATHASSKAPARRRDRQGSAR